MARACPQRSAQQQTLDNARYGSGVRVGGRRRRHGLHPANTGRPPESSDSSSADVRVNGVRSNTRSDMVKMPFCVISQITSMKVGPAKDGRDITRIASLGALPQMLYGERAPPHAKRDSSTARIGKRLRSVRVC